MQYDPQHLTSTVYGVEVQDKNCVGCNTPKVGIPTKTLCCTTLYS